MKSGGLEFVPGWNDNGILWHVLLEDAVVGRIDRIKRGLYWVTEPPLRWRPARHLLHQTFTMRGAVEWCEDYMPVRLD